MPRVKTMFQSWVIDDQTLKQLKAVSRPYCGKPKDQLKKMRKDNSERIVRFENRRQLASFDTALRKDREAKCKVGDSYFVRKRFDKDLLMVFEAKIRFGRPGRHHKGEVKRLCPTSPPRAVACHP